MIIYYFLLLLAAVYQYPHLPQFYGLTLIKVVGIAAVAIACVRILGLPQPLYLFRWAEARLFILLFFMVVASQAMVYAEHGVISSMLWSYCSHAGFLLATLAFLDSFKRVETACYVLVVSMALLALSAFKDYVRWDIGRPGGFAGDPNYAALVALCMLPMCLLLYQRNTFNKKVLLGVTSILMIASFLLSASRGGLIGLAVSLGYIMVRTRKKVAVLVSLIVVLLCSAMILPHTGIGRFEDIATAPDRSIRGRIELLKAGWNMIEAHPLTGIGVGMFKSMSQVYNPDVFGPQIAHNTYVELAAEMGIPALLVYLGIVLYSWRRARMLAKEFRRRGDTISENVAASLEIGIVGFSVAAAFLSAAYIRHFWFLVFFGLALQRLVAIEEEQPVQPVEVTRQRPSALGQPGVSALGQRGLRLRRQGLAPLRREEYTRVGQRNPGPSGLKRPAVPRR